MTKENIRDYSMSITQASRTGLVVITYNIIIDYINEALRAHGEDRLSDYRTALKKAKSFLAELSGALDMQYELSHNLMRLYLFMNREMVKADSGKDVTNLSRIRDMLKELRDAFCEVGKTDNSGPVMENTQTVYAGLTYSKGSLNENMYSAGNRGYTV